MNQIMRTIYGAPGGALLISIYVFITVSSSSPFRRKNLEGYLNGRGRKRSIEAEKYSSPLHVCQRQLLSSPSSNNFKKQYPSSHAFSKDVVVLGYDDMNHVQTNNHVNAIFHAMDYAREHDSTLVLIRKGWPMKALALLFQGNSTSTNKAWELELTHNIGVLIESFDNIMKKYQDREIKYLAGDEAYYYHSKVPVKEIVARRKRVLEYLWTHPTTSLCAAVENTISSEKDYTVIHSRWMKNEGCKKRLGSLSHRIKTNYEGNLTQESFNLDRTAPCILGAEYIEQIINSTKMFGKPIFIISDGLNPSILTSLKDHHRIGPYVQNIPGNKSSVGNDMMLGALSKVFIGTPISTMSGNIARARIALGFDPKSNFLFPINRQDRNGGNMPKIWEFACQNEECLYNVNILHHYVG